jgi:hypothetical protein
MQDQQAMIDFEYAAIGRVTVIARQIVEAYYAKPPAHSYFSGCSTGGREAMLMTERYPLYFDGVIAGAPAIRTGHSNLADRTVSVALSRIAPKGADGKPVPGGGLSDSDRKLIISRLLRANTTFEANVSNILNKMSSSTAPSCSGSPVVIIQPFSFRTFMAFRSPVGHTASQAPQPLHFAESTPGKDS